MKFWIRINGLQEGPMEIEQMKEFNITPTTYVWCAGMKDWAYARDVEDLKEVLSHCQNTENVETTEVTEEETVPTEVADVEVATVIEESHNEETTDEIIESENAQQIKIQEEVGATDKTIAEDTKVLPPCPPTNLVWAVITTVLCCQITGIISIIFAAQVTSKYNIGDYETAKKYSDWSAWLVIASVVLSILWNSFAFSIMMMGEMMK